MFGAEQVDIKGGYKLIVIKSRTKYYAALKNPSSFKVCAKLIVGFKRVLYSKI